MGGPIWGRHSDQFRYSLTHKAQRVTQQTQSCWNIIIGCIFPTEGLQTTLNSPNKQIYQHLIPQRKKIQWFHFASNCTKLSVLDCLFRVRSQALGFRFSIINNYVDKCLCRKNISFWHHFHCVQSRYVQCGGSRRFMEP